MSGTPLATVVRYRGGFLGGDSPPGRVPHTTNGPPSPTRVFPGQVSNLPARLTASSLSAYGNRHHDGERCPGDSAGPRPRLLQPPLPSGESLRRLVPCYRPLSSERIHPADPVQDGNPKFRPLSSQTERLPRLHRPQGRVLPGTRTSRFQEATSVRLERQGLPVQGTVLQPIDRPTGVHEGLCGGLFLGSRPGNPPAAIPGRLADIVPLGETDATTYQPTPFSLPLAQHSHKRGEVQPLPVQVCQISRHGDRHSVCPSVPDRGPNTEVPLPVKEVPRPTEPPGLPVASTPGPHVVSRETGAPSETSNTLTPVPVEVQLVHRNRLPTPPDTPVPASEHGHRMVDVEGPSSPGGRPSGHPPPPRTSPVLRRISVGVGSPPPRSVSVGTMVGPGDLSTSTSWR